MKFKRIDPNIRISLMLRGRCPWFWVFPGFLGVEALRSLIVLHLIGSLVNRVSLLELWLLLVSLVLTRVVPHLHWAATTLILEWLSLLLLLLLVSWNKALMLLHTSRNECLGWWLGDWSSSSNCFNLLDLELNLWFFSVFIAKSLVFLVDIQDKLLNMVTSDLILIEEPGTYT